MTMISIDFVMFDSIDRIVRTPSKANAFDGEVLTLMRVSRLHIGAYLCIASNGIPPSVSKRIVLNVQCMTSGIDFLLFLLFYLLKIQSSDSLIFYSCSCSLDSQPVGGNGCWSASISCLSDRGFSNPHRVLDYRERRNHY